jgi:hypothetical protein
MDTEHLHPIAALVCGKLSPEERQSLLSKIEHDSKAMKILALSTGSDTSATETPTGVPFPVAGVSRMGLCEGFFRFFDREETTFSGLFGSVAGRMVRVSSGHLPICFKRVVELEGPSDFGGVLRVAAEEAGEPISLSFHLRNSEPEPHERLEFWRNSSLIRSCPLDSESNLPLEGLEAPGVWHVRRSSRLGAMAMSIREVRFEPADWLAASLCCALQGDLKAAAEILKTRLKEDSGIQKIFEKTGAFLETIRSLASVQNGMLVPLPATRSARLSGLDMETTLTSVREGLLNFYPELRHPEVWQGDEGSKPRPASVPHEVLHVVDVIMAAREKHEILLEGRSIPNETVPLAAWKTLSGWDLALKGEFNRAIDELESAPRLENDPFNLNPAVSLLRYLNSHRREVSEEGSKASDESDEVWRAIYGDLLPDEEEPPR